MGKINVGGSSINIFYAGDEKLGDGVDKTGITSSTLTKVSETKFTDKGTYRIKYTLTVFNVVGQVQIYVDGSPVGTLQQESVNGDYLFSEDIEIPRSGLMQFYARRVSGTGTLQIKDITYNVSEVPVFFEQII